MTTTYKIPSLLVHILSDLAGQVGVARLGPHGAGGGAFGSFGGEAGRWAAMVLSQESSRIQFYSTAILIDYNFNFLSK